MRGRFCNYLGNVAKNDYGGGAHRVLAGNKTFEYNIRSNNNRAVTGGGAHGLGSAVNCICRFNEEQGKIVAGADAAPALRGHPCRSLTAKLKDDMLFV